MSKGSKLKLLGKNTVRGSVACTAASSKFDDDDGGEKSKRLSDTLRWSVDDGRGCLEVFLLMLSFLLLLVFLLLVLTPLSRPIGDMKLSGGRCGVSGASSSVARVEVGGGGGGIIGWLSERCGGVSGIDSVVGVGTVAPCGKSCVSSLLSPSIAVLGEVRPSLRAATLSATAMVPG